ncbi:transporter [Burkholderia lata]|uniref:Transporter n=2 Tax=Burkholderia lata (strain ATCC 17760 / DSM 23089 / LMG 22485 / NCIMB 9086 / R18194 / 383) TaxID=482957 RepID=A0A6P2XA06_BURL3|nr:transporter [Burkholderia lata]
MAILFAGGSMVCVPGAYAGTNPLDVRDPLVRYANQLSVIQNIYSRTGATADPGISAGSSQSGAPCLGRLFDRGNPGYQGSRFQIPAANQGVSGVTYVADLGCSVALGMGASADAQASIAIGDSARAAQVGVALGFGAVATNGSGVAIGPVAQAGGSSSIAIGRQSAANGNYSLALGNVSYAPGAGGIAIGNSAAAEGYRSIAIGASDINAGNASTNGPVAGGALYGNSQTRAMGIGSVALGASATASDANSVVLGSWSVSAPNATGLAMYSGDAIASNGAVSVGKAGSERQVKNVAGGTAGTDAVNVNQLTAVWNDAVKYDDPRTGSINTVTLKPGTTLTNVAAGQVSATSTDAVNGSQLYQTNQAVNNLGGSTASVIGGGATYDPVTGKMTGPTFNIAGSQQTTISDAINALNGGWNVTTSGNASGTAVTAIKPGSTMTVDGGKNIALTQDGSTISITTSDTPTFASVGIDSGGPVLSGAGLDMAGRKITNVAPGNVSATSMDAVNGSQLNDTNQKVQQVSDQGVKYDTNADGSINTGSVTLNPGGTPATLTNVAAGQLSATSTDAVNGSQLYQTNQTVNNLSSQVDGIVNGGGVRYFHANGGGATPLPDSQANGTGSTAMGPAATANGANTVAAGNGAVASKDGDVALGAGSLADRGAESYTGKYSGAANETAGTVSVGAPGAERTISNVADGHDATDAVNLRQLDGTLQAAKDYTDQRVQDMTGGKFDQITTQTTNLGDRVTAVEGNVTNLTNGASGMFQVSQDQAPVAPIASGSNSVAGGTGAVASGANSAALGNQASATGSHSTAVGNGAVASGNNSVALGAGSDGSRDNAVSVGSVGQERQIVNVAPGTAGTDAVNVNQLRETERNVGNQIAGVRSDMQGMDHRLSAGIATAMAMAGLPQAYVPGKSMVALGGATWRGESGVALGLSTISDSGKWVVKGSASSTSRGDIGASVGVGYQW